MEIVDELLDADISAKAKDIAINSVKPSKNKKYLEDDTLVSQRSLFDTVKDDDIITELNSMDLSSMTPIEALNTLYRLQNKLKNRWEA